jgi:Protein of unknown function (DUF3918)
VNKVITSVLAVGAGVAAYSYGKRNQRQMRKIKKGLKGIL